MKDVCDPRDVVSHPPTWARRAAATFLVLHAVAHFVGTQDAFRIYGLDQTAGYLVGTWEVGGVALAVLGVAWALTAAGFVLAAWSLWSLRRGWWQVLMTVTGVSLAMTILGLSAAVMGLAINLVLFVGALHWRPAASRLQPRGA